MGTSNMSLKQFRDCVKEEIEASMATDNPDEQLWGPDLALGPAGMGKTWSIQALAKELGIGYKEIRLLSIDPQDITGLVDIQEIYQKKPDGSLVLDANGSPIPVRDSNGNIKKKTSYFANELMPRVETDGEYGILVFDEITSASRANRTAVYGLLDSTRKIGSYVLPPHWKVVCLGNSINDGGDFEGLEQAFISRCTTATYLNCNTDDWLDWARANNVNPSVIAYIEYDKSRLYPHSLGDVNDSDFEEGGIALNPTPRSWTALSSKLTIYEKMLKQKTGQKYLPYERVELYAQATVGDEFSSEFATFYNLNNELIPIESIIKGEVTKEQTNRVDDEVIYLTIEHVLNYFLTNMQGQYEKTQSVTDDDITAAANVSNWFIDLADRALDMSVTGIKLLSAKATVFSSAVLEPSFDAKCPRFSEFCINNSIIMK